ncbi:MAG: putative rhamnosyl transferase [Pseudomonadota bacterium]
MQTIGLCRFSYLGEGGFQVKHETLAARQRYLFAPERLAERFATLETMTLPALRAQTDGDFTLLIVVADALPPEHRARLEAAVAGIPQAVIKAYPPGPHRKVMREAINSVRQPRDAPCLQFRMDDDDAVAVTFVARLKEAAQDLAALAKRHRHIAIDFNQGYIVRPSPQGLAAAPTQAPLSTAALALMFPPDVSLSVMNFGHRKLAQRMPVISFTGEDMLIRGHNGHNDSRQKPGIAIPTFTPLDPAGKAHFKAAFNINADEVAAAFSRLPVAAPDRR